MKRFFKGCLIFLISLIVILFVNYCLYGLTYRNAEVNNSLTLDELQDISEAKRLKNVYGDRLFSGFSKVSMPIVSFNSGYEFLIYDKPLDSSFKNLEKDNKVVRDNIYVRKAENPQAFAVKLGEEWAASMSTYYTFNHEVLGYMERDIPLNLWVLIPPQVSTIKRDLIPCTIIHEAVHAYFGNLNEKKLNKSEESHKALKSYPYSDDQFKGSWNIEGKALYNAMNAVSLEDTIKYTKEFLNVRSARRAEINLSPDMIEAEKLIEWEEGLAKYSEIRMYDFAAEDNNAPSYYKYKKNRPYSRSDFRRLKSSLGSTDGDYRFYLSGMAEAMILDKLSKDWKENISYSGVYLEDKLREAVKNN